ncbi:MAG TPA: DUF1579 domain-containing protein [Candidatus Polarisedimenticolaceae bacterium]|nr:DUF1579 domain-containing protein [Candidatus Polarisedimenticolaceae bacterium]
MSGMRKTIGGVFAAALLCGGATAIAMAQGTPAPPRKVPPPKQTKPAPAAPEATPQTPDEKWKEAATPGEAHKVLENYLGRWKAHIVSRIDPNRPSEETDGTSEGTPLMGGRFVQVVHKATLMGQPFEGMMLIGYDNMAKKYVGEWIDNMGTSFIHYDGSYDKRIKRIMMGAHIVDPMTRQPLKIRSVTAFVDPNNWTYEEFATPTGGREWQTLKITFSR